MGKSKQKHRTFISIERSPEAHHVLPVASVTGNITANDQIHGELVKNTKRCVNDRLSIFLGLALFEMTFTHYLVEYDAYMGTPIPAPPFAGLPMHYYGHAAFQKEINMKRESVGENAKDSTANHEEDSKTLLAAMNGQRDFFPTKAGFERKPMEWNERRVSERGGAERRRDGILGKRA